MWAESPKLYHLKQRRDTGRGVKAVHKESGFEGRGRSVSLSGGFRAPGLSGMWQHADWTGPPKLGWLPFFSVSSSKPTISRSLLFCIWQLQERAFVWLLCGPCSSYYFSKTISFGSYEQPIKTNETTDLNHSSIARSAPQIISEPPSLKNGCMGDRGKKTKKAENVSNFKVEPRK